MPLIGGGGSGPPYGVDENSDATNWQLRMKLKLDDPDVLNSGNFVLPGGMNLSKGAVYRIEHGWTRESDTTFRAYARIHDVNDVLIGDSLDFDNEWPPYQNLTEVHTVDPAMDDWWEGSQWYRLGINGADGSAIGEDIFEYAGFAVCNDWCGAYPIQGVED